MLAILSLVLERGTSSYRLLSSLALFQNKILGFLAIPVFSPSSFSVARRKLSPDLFVDLSQWVYRFVVQRSKGKLWFGRSIYCVDATKIVVPKELERHGFDDMGSPSYYPMAMISVLFDVQHGIAYDAMISQHGDERAAAMALLPSLPEQSLLIADRGYFSFEFVYEAQKNHIDLLLRIQTLKEVLPEEIRSFLASGRKEAVVTISPAKPTERSMIRRGYAVKPLTLRLIAYWKGGTRFLLATTLLDKGITRKDFERLYQVRWDIEEHFKFLKVELAMQRFRSRSLHGVLQEIFATIFLATLTQAMVVLEKGAKTKTPKRVEYALSQVIGIIRRTLVSVLSEVDQSLRDWLPILRHSIHKAASSYRPNRSYPRRSFKPMGKWISIENGVRC